ncbi:MAG: hypothetical protein WBA18_08025 [Terracidiphilus sp.]
MAYVNERTVNGRTHSYNARATAISGDLILPVAQSIVPQTHTTLPEEGGYFSQRAEQYRLEGLISIDASRTHTTGNRSSKPGEGWTTLTTAVVEGLNVMEVVTADRLVCQIVTEHPLTGYVPRINFLGARFENLRVAGNPLTIEYDYDVLGERSPKDEQYVPSSSSAERLSGAYDYLKGRETLPTQVRERYNRLSSTLGAPQEEFECSLVKSVTGTFPGFHIGPVIVVPDFGAVILGKIVVKHEDYKPGTKTPKKTTVTLTMLDFHFGCTVDGGVTTGTGSTNGSTVP